MRRHSANTSKRHKSRKNKENEAEAAGGTPKQHNQLETKACMKLQELSEFDDNIQEICWTAPVKRMDKEKRKCEDVSGWMDPEFEMPQSFRQPIPKRNVLCPTNRTNRMSFTAQTYRTTIRKQTPRARQKTSRTIQLTNMTQTIEKQIIQCSPFNDTEPKQVHKTHQTIDVCQAGYVSENLYPLNVFDPCRPVKQTQIIKQRILRNLKKQKSLLLSKNPIQTLYKPRKVRQYRPLSSQPRTNTVVFADQSINSLIRRHHALRNNLKKKESAKQPTYTLKKYKGQNPLVHYLYEKYDAVINKLSIN